MKKIISIILSMLMLLIYSPSECTVNASGSVFTDPERVPDEEFFGVWENDSWVVESKINYDYCEELKTVEEAVKNGDFTDSDLQVAKEYIISSFSSYEDSPGMLVDYYLGMAFSDKFLSIPEVCSAVNNVSREDVVKSFENVCPDTVYFLNGKENE